MSSRTPSDRRASSSSPAASAEALRRSSDRAPGECAVGSTVTSVRVPPDWISSAARPSARRAVSEPSKPTTMRMREALRVRVFMSAPRRARPAALIRGGHEGKRAGAGHGARDRHAELGEDAVDALLERGRGQRQPAAIRSRGIRSISSSRIGWSSGSMAAAAVLRQLGDRRREAGVTRGDGADGLEQLARRRALVDHAVGPGHQRGIGGGPARAAAVSSRRARARRG